MNAFEEVSLRLKQQLKVTEDRQVAEALGMTGNAWTMRKRRSVFPETELYALVAKRPDLQLDVDYILTGAPSTVRSALHQTAIERQQHEAIAAQLLADWQACSAGDQLIVCDLVARLKTARRPKDTGPVLSAPEQTPDGSEFHYSFARPAAPIPKPKHATQARGPKAASQTTTQSFSAPVKNVAGHNIIQSGTRTGPKK